MMQPKGATVRHLCLAATSQRRCRLRPRARIARIGGLWHGYATALACIYIN